MWGSGLPHASMGWNRLIHGLGGEIQSLESRGELLEAGRTFVCGVCVGGSAV